MAPTTQSVTDQTTPRLLLLDGHSLAYRAFFALPVENFSTTTGQHTNAVFGFTSMLINVLRDEQPTHIAVAFDKSRQTFRLAEYAEYKAKRNKTPDEFSSQLPLIKEVLDALRIEHLHLEGYEADDIIATLATQAEADGLDVLILTGDRDSLQLVSDRTTVLYPSRGVSELARMTPAAVEAKYGVPPARYPELAAIVGETSDNLPGVPGVGPGFAARWINEYDGLDNVITRADEITGKKGEALREHLGDVIRNRRLNALVTDLDLPVAPADLAMRPVGPARGAQPLRRAGVPGAARPALRDREVRGRGGHRRQRLRAVRLGARRRRGRALAGRARRGAGRGHRAGHLAGRHRRGALGRAGRRRRLRRVGRRRRGDPRATTRPWRPGSPTRPRPRSCTTPRARCSRWRRAAGPSPGWSATPRWRRTSCVPTSAPSTSPTSPCATSSAS